MNNSRTKARISRLRIFEGPLPYYHSKQWGERTLKEKFLFWRKFEKEVTRDEFMLAVYKAELKALNR